MSPESVNTLTNVVAALLVIVGAINGYLTTQPFSWPTFIICILMAVTSWYTGKSSVNLKKQLKKAGKL